MGHETIVKILLHAKEVKEKLIEYVMKEDANKATALHFACQNGYEKIVKLLLNSFGGGEEEEEKLIEYLMQKNDFKYTASDVAAEHGYENIVKLLSQKMTNVWVSE